MSASDYNTLSFPKLGWEFVVNSTAFEIFGFSIKWYGLLIVTGLFLAIFYSFKRMEKNGVDPDRAYDVVFIGIVGALIGARLYYVFMTWDDFKDNLISIFYTRNGGLAIYGGIIGALIFGAVVAKIRKLYLPPLLDLAGIGLLIGQAVGRWGNFFNHECFGNNTSLPWGMTSPKIAAQISNEASNVFLTTGVELNPALPVHPCFLYESLWCALGVLLLHLYSKHKKFDGEVFLMYIGWYGFGRMLIEGLRTDSLMIGNFRASQILAAICVLASIISLLALRRKVVVDGYTFYKDTDDFKIKLKESKEKEQKYTEKANIKKAERLAKKNVALKPEDTLSDINSNDYPNNESQSEKKVINSQEIKEENEDGSDN